MTPAHGLSSELPKSQQCKLQTHFKSKVASHAFFVLFKQGPVHPTDLFCFFLLLLLFFVFLLLLLLFLGPLLRHMEVPRLGVESEL